MPVALGSVGSTRAPPCAVMASTFSLTAPRAATTTTPMPATAARRAARLSLATLAQAAASLRSRLAPQFAVMASCRPAARCATMATSCPETAAPLAATRSSRASRARSQGTRPPARASRAIPPAPHAPPSARTHARRVSHRHRLPSAHGAFLRARPREDGPTRARRVSLVTLRAPRALTGPPARVSAARRPHRSCSTLVPTAQASASGHARQAPSHFSRAVAGSALRVTAPARNVPPLLPAGAPRATRRRALSSIRSCQPSAGVWGHVPMASLRAARLASSAIPRARLAPARRGATARPASTASCRTASAPPSALWAPTLPSRTASAP